VLVDGRGIRHPNRDGHRGGTEPPGASTQRVRRFRARQRAKRLADRKAAQIARRIELDAIRISRGLKPAKTSTERAAESRARRAAIRESLLTLKWYLPAIDSKTVERILEERQPRLHNTQYLRQRDNLERECRRYELNLNQFVAENGIQRARERRAIFHQCYLKRQDSLTMFELVQESESVTEIPSEQTLNDAQTKWGAGESIYQAVLGS
jgi:hypothetical protein